MTSYTSKGGSKEKKEFDFLWRLNSTMYIKPPYGSVTAGEFSYPVMPIILIRVIGCTKSKNTMSVGTIHISLAISDVKIYAAFAP